MYWRKAWVLRDFIRARVLTVCESTIKIYFVVPLIGDTLSLDGRRLVKKPAWGYVDLTSKRRSQAAPNRRESLRTESKSMRDRREHKMNSIKNWIVSVLAVVLESHLRKPGDKNMSDRGVFVRVAAFLGLCVFATASDPTRAQTAVSDQSAALDEIVVTAGRREEKAQDYAGALQVISGVDLEKSGANGFVDYLLSIPSASFRDQGNGSIRIGLRGVSNIAG